jgi:hypothetical protein
MALALTPALRPAHGLASPSPVIDRASQAALALPCLMHSSLELEARGEVPGDRAPYRSGPSRAWIKVENPDGPAMQRAGEGR